MRRFSPKRKRIWWLYFSGRSKYVPRMRRSALSVLALMAHLALVIAPVSSAAAELDAATLKALAEEDLIYTATERKDGSLSSAAPIWFWADGESDVLYTSTSPDSWKAKRLERGSPLHIWVGDDDGPYLVGEAERIMDPATITMMGEKYSDKYWIAWVGFFRPRADRVTEGKTIAYRVKLRPGEPKAD